MMFMEFAAEPVILQNGRYPGELPKKALGCGILSRFDELLGQGQTEFTRDRSLVYGRFLTGMFGLVLLDQLIVGNPFQDGRRDCPGKTSSQTSRQASPGDRV